MSHSLCAESDRRSRRWRSRVGNASGPGPCCNSAGLATERLGQRYDDAIGATNVTEQIALLELHNLANEGGAMSPSMEAEALGRQVALSRPPRANSARTIRELNNHAFRIHDQRTQFPGTNDFKNVVAVAAKTCRRLKGAQSPGFDTGNQTVLEEHVLFRLSNPRAADGELRTNREGLFQLNIQGTRKESCSSSLKKDLRKLLHTRSPRAETGNHPT